MSDKHRAKIPECFYKGNLEKPNAKNVGELISQLERLPKGTPIKQGFGSGCVMTVYNIGSKSPFLEILEVED